MTRECAVSVFATQYSGGSGVEGERGRLPCNLLLVCGDVKFEMKMNSFLSQADKLLVSAQAQKCRYVFEIFPCCFCFCCILTCAKKAEKAQFGGSVAQSHDKPSTHERPSTVQCVGRCGAKAHVSSCAWFERRLRVASSRRSLLILSLIHI